ncbi:MAG: CAP domain-containing protein [Planctomycetes bacterium]|nr:CAP domain-containing protein [Planctomycetota bacterium]
MRRTILIVVPMLIAAVSIGCDAGSSYGAAAEQGVEGATLSYPNGHPLDWRTEDSLVLRQEEELLAVINQHRVSMGLPALIQDPVMQECARGHSKHMTNDSHDFLAHRNPEGDSHVERMNKHGLFGFSGENVAAGYFDAASVLAAWLASPPHRQNLEDPRFLRGGAGYQAGAPFGAYWTLVLSE